MRAYREADEETLRIRDLLQDWAGEGLISGEQHRAMEQEVPCDLKHTNIFLRVVSFVFTVLISCAAAGLFHFLFLKGVSTEATGYFLLVCAVASYAASELAVSQGRFYRHGIEEALAACAVGFFWAGLLAIFSGAYVSAGEVDQRFWMQVAAAIASLWIWHRFGLWYAFLVAMLFVASVPEFWPLSVELRRVIAAAFFAVGLGIIAAMRSAHRLTYLDRHYSIAEALLWSGVYVAINLQFSWMRLAGFWTGGTVANGYSPLYWATWVVIWCWPALVLVRGIRSKDRFIIAAGALAAILTLATNKPYLGWPRHTWDPMLLGAVLIGGALFIRRSLDTGPEAIRHGFTARSLSGTDKQLLAAGATVFGMAAPGHITPQPASPEVQFGGGDSGGGGASSDF